MEELKPGGHPHLEILMKYVRKALDVVLLEYVDDHVRGCTKCKRDIANHIFRRPQVRKAAA